jgi:lipoprotein NlpI
MRIHSLSTAIVLSAIWFAPRVAPAAEPADAMIDSARQFLARGDADQAFNIAQAAVEEYPRNPACYAARAAVYDARREFDRAVGDYGRVIELSPNEAGPYERRGEDQFRLGRFKESVADFDKVTAIQPARAPYHWQRGLSLYYAGDFEGGAKQFEIHKTVNPDDVENAVWHYLCVARTVGVDEARKGLIPIQGDARVPMMQIYAMFAGKAQGADVLAAAGAGHPSEARRKQRLFYAHLYIGLFEQAAGHAAAAKEHLLLAAEKYADDDYMGDLARVQAALLKQADSAK